MTNFRKSVSAFALMGVLAAGTAGFAPAEAASSDAVDLSSTVALDCGITVADKDGSIDLVNGENKKKVATVTENCNSVAGYTITLSSANAGNMDGTGALEGNADASIDYNVDYGSDKNLDLASNKDAVRSEAKFDFGVDLKVSVAGNSELLAGAYEDTLTISIAGN